MSTVPGFSADSPNAPQVDQQVLSAAAGISSPEDFKAWTRQAIRPILPHETLACGLGHLHAGGAALDYIVVVDFPLDHLRAIRNRAGAIDTPILRRWLATREAQLFESDKPWPGTPTEWLEHFRANDLRNAAAHACYDTARCLGSYFSFHRIPGRLDARHRAVLERIVPVMHEVLVRVVAAADDDQNAFHTKLAALTEREREIVRWLRDGKTNGAIAAIAGVSEITVKHHLTRVFAKLGVENRVQLIRRLSEDAARPAPGYGTKIL